jgi:phospholipid/cholesterol/gamma-HCH transport system substrate-binding protein
VNSMTKTNHFKIGMFVLCAVAIFLAALFAFGARTYFEPKTVYETYVPGTVEGLAVGSAVKFRGVQVGHVRKISFSWNEYPHVATERGLVVVQFEIRDAVSPTTVQRDGGRRLREAIERGLRARVKSQGITGTSILSLELVDPERYPVVEVPWKPDHFPIPAADSQFNQMLASIEHSLRNLEKLDLDSLNKVLQRDLESLGRLLEQVEKIDFATLGTNVNSLIAEVKVSNGKLQGLLEDTRVKVKELPLNGLVQNADQLLSELRTSLTKLQPAIDNLDTAPLTETLVNARQATEKLNDVLTDLKQYPSGFLFGEPPSRARSVERPSR